MPSGTIETISENETERHIEDADPESKPNPFGKVNFDILDNPPETKQDILPREDKVDGDTQQQPSVPDAKKEPEEGKKEEEKKQDDPDADIEGFQLKPGTHPKVVESVSQLRGIAKEARKQAREYQSKLKEVENTIEAYKTELSSLKQQPATTPEEIKKYEERIKQLEHYEFLLNSENSTYVTKEYDEKIKSLNETAYEILKANNASENEVKNDKGEELFSIAAVKKAGGILGVPWDQWEAVLPHLKPLDRERLKAKLLEAAETEDQKKKAISSAPTKLQELFKTKQTESEAKKKQDEDIIRNRISEIQKEQEWARVKEVPANATPEQKAQIEQHNKWVQEGEAMFPRLIEPKNAIEKTNLAVGFLYGLRVEKEHNVLVERYNALEKKYKELETKMNGVKKAADTRARDTATPAVKSNRMATLEENFAQHLDHKES